MPRIAEIIEDIDALDSVGKTGTKVAAKLVPPGGVEDALTGKWQGHAVHPMLTDVAIGLFVSAAFLDVVGSRRHAKSAQKLMVSGILSALPTAWSGMADWKDTIGPERRVGAVHAVANSVALNLFLRSCAGRRQGRRAKTIGYSLAGVATLGFSGYLGGHLAHRRGVGVDHTAFEKEPADWTPVLAAHDLPEKTMTKAQFGDLDILLYRQGNQVNAISGTCSHFGGPLGEGQVSGQAVTCPWHGSEFDLRSGDVLSGPASAPQPHFEARIAGDKVEVRSPQ